MPYALQRLLALCGLVVCAPVMAGVALTIRVLDGPPMLFSQHRVGRGHAVFRLWKFRTMKPNADDSLRAGTDPAHRLTRSGRILRRSGLDELPQLVNIALGEMALVGPRALLPEVAANVPERYRRRFDVLPGLTGLAQVQGRNALLWSKRLELDARYVGCRSFGTDARILAQTVWVLLTGAGFSADRNTTQTDDLGLLSGAGEQR